MANPNPAYANVQWPGADGLRVPNERAGFIPKTTQTQPSVQTYGELDLGSVGASTVTLNAQQAGASLITITPTGAVTIVLPTCQPGHRFFLWNLAVATNSVTVQIAGKRNQYRSRTLPRRHRNVGRDRAYGKQRRRDAGNSFEV